MFCAGGAVSVNKYFKLFFLSLVEPVFLPRRSATALCPRRQPQKSRLGPADEPFQRAETGESPAGGRSFSAKKARRMIGVQTLPRLRVILLGKNQSLPEGGAVLPEKIDRLPKRVPLLPERSGLLLERTERRPEKILLRSGRIGLLPVAGGALPERIEPLPERNAPLPEENQSLPKEGESWHKSCFYETYKPNNKTHYA